VKGIPGSAACQFFLPLSAWCRKTRRRPQNTRGGHGCDRRRCLVDPSRGPPGSDV